MQNERGADSSLWWQFVEGHLAARGWSGADFERASGINRARLVNWRNGSPPSVDLVRDVARCFTVNPPALRRAPTNDASIVHAFIAAGFATAEELGEAPVPPDPRALSSAELVRELARRMGVHEVVTLAPPTDDEIAANPGRYSVGRLSLDDVDHGTGGAVAGDPPKG